MDGVLALHDILRDTRVKKRMGWCSNLILKKLMTKLAGTSFLNVSNNEVFVKNGVTGLNW